MSSLCFLPLGASPGPWEDLSTPKPVSGPWEECCELWVQRRELCWRGEARFLGKV